MSEPRTDDSRIRRIVARDPNGDLQELQVDADGNLLIAGSGGSGGDASAANQTTQIAQIGEVQASPTANTVLDRLKTIASKIPGLGAATAANSLPVVLATDSAVIGATNETAPGTDTAASGLNGRLQRVAQNITSLLGKLPSALVSNRLDVNVGAIGVALPAGTNNIGDVDVLTVPADPFGANADAASASGSISAKLRQIATTGIPVTALPALPAGTNNVGKVRSSSEVVEFTPTLDTSVYAAGDVLFATTAITSVFPANNGKGILHSLVVNDKDDQKPVFDLYFLRANTSIGTINAAPSITDAGADDIVARVSIASADWRDLGGCSVAVVPSIGQVIETGAATTSLWVAAVLVSGTPTHTASGLVFKLGFVDLTL